MFRNGRFSCEILTRLSSFLCQISILTVRCTAPIAIIRFYLSCTSTQLNIAVHELSHADRYTELQYLSLFFSVNSHQPVTKYLLFCVCWREGFIQSYNFTQVILNVAMQSHQVMLNLHVRDSLQVFLSLFPVVGRMSYLTRTRQTEQTPRTDCGSGRTVVL